MEAEKDGWHSSTWFAGIATMRRLGRRELLGDVVAGLAVTALLIPLGMAYAELAGLPAVTGLYTTVLSLLAYAVVGPSRILILGPDSSLAPLIAAALVLVSADGDPGAAVSTAAMLAVFTGLFCILGGFSGLGMLAELLSKPIRVGYLNGLAIAMVVGQLPKLFGFSVRSDTTAEAALDFLDGLFDGRGASTPLILGLVCLGVIMAAGRVSPAVPGVLIAVVGAAAAVVLLDLDEVAVVGSVPGGFPEPAWPDVAAGDLPELLIASLGIAVMTLSDTTSLSRGIADLGDDDVDPNHEIMALGVANISAGLFQGFPVSASTTRTTVAVASGGRSQLVGVVGAGLVVVLLTFGGGLVEDIPSAALAAIIIAAAVQLFDLEAWRWLLSVRRSEFLLSIATTIGVVAVGVLEGIGIAIVLSLASFIFRLWRPHDSRLGRVERRTGFHDIERHPDAHQVPAMLIYRFDAPLFFANAGYFQRRLRLGILDANSPVARIVVAAEPITDVDTTGAEVLNEILDELEADGTSLVFAGMRGPVKDRLQSYGLVDRLGVRGFYSTIDHAIEDYVEETGVYWPRAGDA